VVRVSAADPVAVFEQANKLYEQGKYGDAIAAYETLLGQKEISPALYFNLGNTCFKNGKTGQAIVYYRLAERLAPRDPDIRANLRFVRETVGSNVSSSVRWQRWLNMLTLNELTLITVLAVWVWLLILAVGQWPTRWGISMRPYRGWSGMIALLLLVWLGFMTQHRLWTMSAVVVAREADVRYGPLEEAQSVYRARDGAEFEILDQKDSWLQVQDAAKRVGWVSAKDVYVLPRG
jgi:tetratricopeptide (TPR) repeat protein